jgi:hypothetical protein
VSWQNATPQEDAVFDPNRYHVESALVGGAAHAVLSHMYGNPVNSLRVTLPADSSYSVAGDGHWTGSAQYLAITTAASSAASERYTREAGRWPGADPNLARNAAGDRTRIDQLSREYPGYVDTDQAVADAGAIMGNREVWAATLALAQRLDEQPYLRGEEIAAVLGRFDLADVPEARDARLIGEVPAILRYGPGGAQPPRPGAQAPPAAGVGAAVSKAAEAAREPAKGRRSNGVGTRLRDRLAKMCSSARGSRL